MTEGIGQGNAFLVFDQAGSDGGRTLIVDFGATPSNKIFMLSCGPAGVREALSSAPQVGTSTVFSFIDGRAVTTVTLDNLAR